MAKAFLDIEATGEAQSLSHAEWLGLLLDREASCRRDKRLAARLRHAKLRQEASVEDVDYKSPRGLDRALFLKLAEGQWIAEHGNLRSGARPWRRTPSAPVACARPRRSSHPR